MKATGCVSCETGEAFACTCARCSDVASALIRGARCLKILHWRCFKDAVLQVCSASRPELLTVSRRVAEANATTRPRRTHRNALASKCVNLMCVQVRQDQKHRVYIIFYNAALILNLVMDIALQGSEDASQAQIWIRGVSLDLCPDSGSQGYLSYLQMVGVGARVADGRLLGSLQSFQDTANRNRPGPKTFQAAFWVESGPHSGLCRHELEVAFRTRARLGTVREFYLCLLLSTNMDMPRSKEIFESFPMQKSVGKLLFKYCDSAKRESIHGSLHATLQDGQTACSILSGFVLQRH